VKTWAEKLTANEDSLASDLATLGYPGLSYLKPQQQTRNPAELLLTALGQAQLDIRLVEALPWVVLQFPELDWRSLTAAVTSKGLQNRLGFIIGLARDIAEQRGDSAQAAALARAEAMLEPARLPHEDTLCHAALTRAEKEWLRRHRSRAAQHWRLLTDLTAAHLDYAA